MKTGDVHLQVKGVNGTKDTVKQRNGIGLKTRKRKQPSVRFQAPVPRGMLILSEFRRTTGSHVSNRSDQEPELLGAVRSLPSCSRRLTMSLPLFTFTYRVAMLRLPQARVSRRKPHFTTDNRSFFLGPSSSHVRP